MHSFTVRPTTTWSISDTSYRKGTYKELFSNISSDSGGETSAGLTVHSENGQTLNFTEQVEYGESGHTSFQITGSTYTASGTNAESNTALNSFDHFTHNEDRTHRTAVTNGETARSSSRGSTESEREQYSDNVTHYDTSSPAPIVTNGTVTVDPFTENGTSWTYTQEQQTAFDSIFTYTVTDGAFAGISTSTYTIDTTHTSQESSSWDTCGTYISDLTTTTTNQDGESSHAMTYMADTTDGITSADGTSFSYETSFVLTGYAFEAIEDTIILLNANRDTDYNLSGILWTLNWNDSNITGSSVGRFSNLYSSVDSQTFTFADRKMFSSYSYAETGIPYSVEQSSSVNSTSGTDYWSVTKFSNTVGSSTQYGSTATVSATQNFTMAGVGESVETYLNPTNTTEVLNSTVFTYIGYSSSYSPSSSVWGFEEVTSIWVSATSKTFARNALYNPVTTTTLVSYPGTTVDEVLVSSFSVTGTGTDSGVHFLGLIKQSSSRVLSLERVDTISVWSSKFHSSIADYISVQTFTHSSDTDASTDHRGQTLTYLDELNVTQYYEEKFGALVNGIPVNADHPPLNEARFRAHPVGYCGFGGSFSAPDLTVYTSTTGGLAAGSRFTSDQEVYIGATALAAEGVSFFAVHDEVEIFGGAESASIISAPSSMVSLVSIAVTWTGTTSTGSATSDTIVSSLSATHTIGVVGEISGQFWASEALTYNSAHRPEFAYIGGEFTGAGGFGIGNNALESSYQVIVNAGYVEWTEYSETQSTAGVSYTSSGSSGSVTFSVPWSHAIVFSAEAMLTVKWYPLADDHNYFFSTPFLPSLPA